MATDAEIAEDLASAITHCDHLARALEQYGHPVSRQRPPGFATLLRAIVGQQISTKAAATVWQRLEDNIGADADKVARCTEDDLRALGMSGRKASYMQHLAQSVQSGALNFDDLATQTDEDAIKTITQIKGLGRWSAQVYLMFAEDRRDIWPEADLALQDGLRRIFELKARPTEKESLPLVEHWRPYRSAAALLTWRVYGSASLDD